MTAAPIDSHFKWVGELSGERLCDECHGQYATDKWEVGLALRGLCDSCARKIGGAHYFKPKGSSDWPSKDETGAESTGSPNTTTDVHDIGNRRIDDLLDNQVDYSIRSEKEFPTRAREYLDIVGRIHEDINIKAFDIADMARCFYKVQGRTFQCENGHKTTHFRRDKNERMCPRCNRAYRFRMADQMVTLTQAFGCTFLMRFVFTVPQEERDIPLRELLDKVNRTMRAFFSDADILPYWAIPHEFSSRYPPRRNPHVEVFMMPIGVNRTWYDREIQEWRDFELVTIKGSKSRAVRIDNVIQYDKWMLADEKLDELGKEIDSLRQTLQPTLDLPAPSDFTKSYVEMQVSAIKNRMKAHKHLEDLRKIWRREFSDCQSELNVFYNYVGLHKAQYHTIPYALRPPFGAEYTVVLTEDDKVVYEIDRKTHETIELELDDVAEIFRYDYYNTRTHRIHRMGVLSNSVWRKYYRALTGEEPPPLDADGDEDETIACAECDAAIVELWTNDYGWYDWLKDVFMEKGIEVHLLRGIMDFFAYTKLSNTTESLSTSTNAEEESEV